MQQPALYLRAHKMLEIDLAGERVGLLVERGLLWPAQKTLVLADVHWGKAGHFRKHGIGLPAKAQQGDEVRLAGLVRTHCVERLIVAGDLFHSADNAEVETFTHWRGQHTTLHIDFVMGNHDILPAERYAGWDFHTHRTTLEAGPFTIAHDDIPDPRGFLLHGHLHPGVKIHGLGGKAIGRPCFAVDARRMILPAFGRFTGCMWHNAAHFDQLYAVGDEEVVRLK